MFVDGRWVRVGGSHGAAEYENGNIYFALSLRNVGAGLAVLQSWYVRDEVVTGMVDHAPVEEMRAQSRDLYVPAGDIGVWQGALRDAEDPAHRAMRAAIDGRAPFTIELLYTDHAGGHRTISRFTVAPASDDSWLVGAGRHWYLDDVAPR
jgi:hypothetical protein